MSLGKLLKAGKGLMGGPDGTRYQMNKHIRLPKFGSSRNPFAPEAPAESVSALRVKNEPAFPAPAASPAPVPVRAVSPRRGVRLAVVGRAVRNLGAQWGKVNPFAGRTKDSRTVRVELPHPGGVPPVQGELSLEKVRVVRNDLSDADLEIIPAATPVASAESPPLVAAIGKHGPAGNAWSRLTTRFFGAGTPG